jgi:CheY-like chemotaxis protein
VRNLVSNAIKFSRSNGAVEVNIYRSEKDSLPRIRIEFVDSGVGISQDNLKKLFNQGIQFDAAKNQKGGGSGMGLWICKQIIDMHGGTVGCESKGEGHGCTFFVELSLENASIAGPLVNSMTAPDAQLFSPQLPCLHFLIVDDSAPNRKVLGNILASKGHKCSFAIDGLKAVETVQRILTTKNSADTEELDVILMDYQMPNMNGPDASFAIRQMGFRGILLGISGTTIREEQEEFVLKGANRVLLKPVSIDTIIATTNDVLGEIRTV